MQHLGEERSAIREIFEYGNKRKAEIGEDKVFDFSLGNPSVPSPACVTTCIENILKNADGSFVHSYTSANGSLECRKAIAGYITSNFNFPAAPENIFLTCGAAASLSITASALFESDGEVIVFAPYFPEYKVFIEFAGMKVKTVFCRNSDFGIDGENLKNAINEHTVAIILNSPNNPTGKVLSEKEIVEISDILREKEAELKRNIYIIADEPYRELVYSDVFVPYIPSYYDNTVVCYSFSKSMSLPGERIGYIFVPDTLFNKNEVYSAVCGAARALGYVCAPSLFQKVITECIGNFSDMSAYKENLSLLTTALKDSGFSFYNPEGAFYIFLKSPDNDAAAFCETAKKYELLLVPGDSFGYPGYARISYCVKRETVLNSLPAFKKLAQEYKDRGKI